MRFLFMSIFVLSAGCYKRLSPHDLETDKFVYWSCGPSLSEDTLVTVIFRDKFSMINLELDQGDELHEVSSSFDGRDFYSVTSLPFYDCDGILSLTVKP
tara:strand:- start:199 stop:495 length:297 start_codon:yes stop_codon:yes gene_type:complete